MIRLIATDLDGTLLSPGGHEMTARNRKALLAAVEQGIHIVVCTGRLHACGVPFALELPGDLPVISCNGGVVRLSRSGEVLARCGVAPELVRELLPKLREAGMKPWFYIGDSCFAEEETGDLRALVTRTGVHVELVDSLESIADRQPEKILGILPEKETAALQEKLAREFQGRLYVTRSLPTQIEILSPKASKGKALEFVAQRFGVSKEEVMALGDNLNDLEMFTAAGLKVAMGNAEPELKAQADWITGTNEESGVAQAIEKALSLS